MKGSKLEKLIKFTDFLIQEISQDWILSGRSDKMDKEAVMLQARAIAEELIKDYPNLTLSYLHLLPKIIRKNGYKIDWKSIAYALNSPEYQLDVKDMIDRDRKNIPLIESSVKIPSLLEKSVRGYVIKQEMGTPNDYQGTEHFDRVLEYRQYWEDNHKAIEGKILDLYGKLQSAGWQESQIFEGKGM